MISLLSVLPLHASSYVCLHIIGRQTTAGLFSTMRFYYDPPLLPSYERWSASDGLLTQKPSRGPWLDILTWRQWILDPRVSLRFSTLRRRKNLIASIPSSFSPTTLRIVGFVELFLSCQVCRPIDSPMAFVVILYPWVTLWCPFAHGDPIECGRATNSLSILDAAKVVWTSFCRTAKFWFTAFRATSRMGDCSTDGALLNWGPCMPEGSPHPQPLSQHHTCAVPTMFLHSFTSVSLTICALAFLSMALFRMVGRKACHRYPPGPKPLPLFGNLFNMPRTDLGRGFAELSQRYGDLVYLNVFGQRMLIIGSYEAAEEILDKRSASTSDRPDSTMLRLSGLQWFFPLMSYGQAWRRRRRAFHQALDAHVISQYWPIQTFRIHRLVRNLLDSPQGLEQHVKFSLAATALQVAYGIKLQDIHEKPYTIIERLVDILADVSIPGKYVVEVFPILQHLPSWLPWMGFKRYAATAKSEAESILARLHEMSAAGNNSAPGIDSSIIGRISNDHAAEATGADESAELEDLCKSTGASAYLAGVETTNTMAQAFLVLMALYPRVQQKAQEELHTVVGPDRLPMFSDIGSLPYLDALIRELLRWHSPVPCGLPHRTTSDEEYNGYFIPEGTIVFVSAWALSRNSKEYPNPESFIPERFLDREGNDRAPVDPRQFAYGHGRRICPGRYFADATLALLCASVLHVFDIKPPMDENGTPQKIEYKVMNDNAVSHPVMYDLVITPRSAGAENLILSMDAGST